MIVTSCIFQGWIWLGRGAVLKEVGGRASHVEGGGADCVGVLRCNLDRLAAQRNCFYSDDADFRRIVEQCGVCDK